MARLIYLRPVREIEPGSWRDLGELDDTEMKAAIQRAESMGYSEESWMDVPPYTNRIRLNGEGHHDYFATARD